MKIQGDKVFINQNFIKQKIIKVFLVFFLLLTISVNSAFSQSKDLRIMSFNIRYGNANDGENSWINRKEYVFDIIKKYKPDLLGLQEALKFQIDEILEALPEYDFIGVGRDDGIKAGEYSCIIYKKNRFEVDTTQTFWFSETPDISGSKHWGNNFPRICTWAKFLDLNTKKYFFYYNLHLDHESQISREKSTVLLIDKIKSQNEKLPLIITGDFNCSEENQAIKTVINFGLKDSYREVNSKNKNEATFNNFNQIIEGERIDFIFTSKDFKTLKAKIVRDNYSGKLPADHYPVFSKIKMIK